MTKKEIHQEIKLLLIQMGIAPKSITKQASYYKDLGLDSLDFAELIMECESRLDLSINCDMMEQLHTVKDTIDYVYQLKKSTLFEL